MLRADRYCRRCKKPVAWRKDRPPGARAALRRCLDCGSPTVRIKGRRAKDTMPSPLLEHRALLQQADDLWRKVIYRKAPDGRCRGCGRQRALQAAHNVSRRVVATRHDPDNGLPLCAGCHMEIDGDPEAKRLLFAAELGPERYNRLQLMKRAGGKTDLKLVILDLERLLEGVDSAEQSRGA